MDSKWRNRSWLCRMPFCHLVRQPLSPWRSVSQVSRQTKSAGTSKCMPATIAPWTQAENLMPLATKTRAQFRWASSRCSIDRLRTCAIQTRKRWRIRAKWCWQRKEFSRHFHFSIKWSNSRSLATTNLRWHRQKKTSKIYTRLLMI